MIKKIEYTETPFFNKETCKFEQFADDIKEIIENKIEYAELINMPYSNTTANQDLAYKSRKIIRNYVWDTYGKTPTATDFMSFAKKHQKDGCHWFVKFNVYAFEKMVNELELS